VVPAELTTALKPRLGISRSLLPGPRLIPIQRPITCLLLGRPRGCFMRVFEKGRYVGLWNPHKLPHTQWLNIALRRLCASLSSVGTKSSFAVPTERLSVLAHVINLDAISPADRRMDQGPAPHRRRSVTLIARHVTVDGGYRRNQGSVLPLIGGEH